MCLLAGADRTRHQRRSRACAGWVRGGRAWVGACAPRSPPPPQSPPRPRLRPALPAWPRLRRRRRERAAREAAPLRNAAGRGRLAGAGVPGRKRAGRAGVAADMCRMSFKVSATGSGRECRAGRQTCGGGQAPGALPGSPAPRGRQGGVRAALGARGGQGEATGLEWLLWFVVRLCGLCLKGFRYLRPQGRGARSRSEGAAGTVAGVTGGGGAGKPAVSAFLRPRPGRDAGCGTDSRLCVLISECQRRDCRLLSRALFGR